MISQKDEFKARVARINGGGQNTRNTVYLGLDEAFVYIPAARVKTSVLQVVPAKLLAGASLFVTLCLGMLAQIIARCLWFYATGAQQFLPDADYDMAVNAATGTIIAIGFAQLFRLRSRLNIALLLLGVACMVGGFHNLVHWAPGPFEWLFSTLWVTEVLLTTPANTLAFRGGFITF